MKRIVYASPEALSDIAEAALHKQDGLSIPEVAEYLDASIKYATDVTIAAVNLGILVVKEGKYLLNLTATDLAKAAKNQRSLLFRKFLINFDPFVIFASLLLKGNNVEDSARRVKVIFSVPESLTIVLKTLRSWGLFSGVISQGPTGEQVTGIKSEEELNEQYLQEFIRALKDEWHAKLFIAGKVRDGAYVFLNEVDKTNLVNSLKKYRDYPDDSMKDIGNVLENFLRKIGSEKQLTGLVDQKGIGQLANFLRTKNVILEEHKKMCNYVNIFRIAADHGSHPEILRPWKIEKDSALEAFLSNLTTIRSIYAFTGTSDLIL